MKPETEKAIRRQQGQRDHTDGEPFYCVFCGSGWNEYGACEDVRCELEEKQVAMKRFEPSSTIPVIIGYNVGDYSDIIE